MEGAGNRPTIYIGEMYVYNEKKREGLRSIQRKKRRRVKRSNLSKDGMRTYKKGNLKRMKKKEESHKNG